MVLSAKPSEKPINGYGHFIRTAPLTILTRGRSATAALAAPEPCARGRAQRVREHETGSVLPSVDREADLFS